MAGLHQDASSTPFKGGAASRALTDTSLERLVEATPFVAALILKRFETACSYQRIPLPTTDDEPKNLAYPGMSDLLFVLGQRKDGLSGEVELLRKAVPILHQYNTIERYQDMKDAARALRTAMITTLNQHRGCELE